jgi:glyoxylase-like metal-dependent hydrolase (beta-lactamase superfamily II)
MTKVKVLVEGCAKEENGVEFAFSSATLLQENGLNIVVDPGMDRQQLLKSLSTEGLSPASINYVVLTHTHLDHCLLAGIFENAKVLDGDSIYSSDGMIVPHDGKVPGTDIEIIPTPGHDSSHCSVLADTEEFGKVAVVGDVFWWRTGEAQEIAAGKLLNREDPYMKNKDQLIESRKKILAIADYIIPGHGKMFKGRI